MSDPVHYEVFIRRGKGAPWVLDMATEDRNRAVTVAEELLEEQGVAAVRVTKETMDTASGEFKSITILNKGDKTEGKSRRAPENLEPLCVSPQDLYTAHARDRIARLLDAWLARHKVTPFELLHRADLLELLDASGTELQHAIQKVAVPEAQARGVSTHDIMRTFQSLSERGIARVMKDEKRGAFPDIEKEGFAAAAVRVVGDAERAYLLGAAVAKHIAEAKDWGDKVNRLLDLADQAPEGPPSARGAALFAIEGPLAEILGSRAGMGEVLGAAMDLGHSLAAMTRLAGAEQVEALLTFDPGLARCIPELPGPAARLANWLDGPHFEQARAAIAKRVLRELHGVRRLNPTDADNEIELLRALAMALTAAAGRMLTQQEIQDAFTARSGMLVAGDFVLNLLGEGKAAAEEAATLIRLCENVTGAANKRAASRYLAAHVQALRFEKELRFGPETPAQKLAILARLQRDVGRARLVDEDAKPIQARLGDIGGMIENESKLVMLLAKAQAPAVHRLSLLLKLATGESAPLGPAAERARVEAMRLVRAPELRDEVARSPEKAVEVRELLASAARMAA
ncbi:MAG: hypothetical protein BGN86_15840 [Caulobacterales bacterium 68-7]|nr:hypothetical protein [Caulobacterales bacterium]OJU13161.1 MAG: hypothetical protein BGN86_15840 [Caulobacterales bacterium 68-7]